MSTSYSWKGKRRYGSFRLRMNAGCVGKVWYGIVEFNVPLDTVLVISEMTTLNTDVHLPFSNGGPAT